MCRMLRVRAGNHCFARAGFHCHRGQCGQHTAAASCSPDGGISGESLIGSYIVPERWFEPERFDAARCSLANTWANRSKVVA
jgi:hypothetical protein